MFTIWGNVGGAAFAVDGFGGWAKLHAAKNDIVIATETSLI